MSRQAPAKGTRLFTLVKRGLLWLGIAFVACILLGCVYQVIATEIDKRTFTPPGQLLDVEGHAMHIYCVGAGSPTVILETGGFTYSTEWYWVQQQLSATQRVCTYDRAGTGWSAPGPAPRTALHIVTELHALLEKAHIDGPYVLAGHSFGGILNGIYASQYPEQVAGVVLVDTAYASALHFSDETAYQQWKRDNDLLNAPLWALSRTGIIRLINAGALQGNGYPPQALAELVALRSTNQAFDTYYAEGIAATWLNQQAFADIHLGDRPLLVLWATILPRKLTPDEEVQLAALQREVAALSSNSQTRSIEGSDHGSIIGNEQYAQQVTNAILDVIRASQTGAGLAHN